MKIQSKGALLYEMVKIKTAVKTRNAETITQYYEEYLAELSASSREIFHAGCFTLYSEKISYHLLSTYLLLDFIDFYWDGKKFIHDSMEPKPNLLEILSVESVGVFKKKQKIQELLYNFQKLTKHRLHVFLLPLQYKEKFSLEITYPGNVLILFPNETDETEIEETLYQGLSEFYFRKQLKEILPHWADTLEDFQQEFVKWATNKPSKFIARKMTD